MTAEQPQEGAAPPEASPFAAFESVYDPESVRLLYARGIDDGWRCLEVGAGGGTLVKWLCQRVGKNGRVVATDLDIRYLESIDEPNLEVHQHDIRTDPLPEGAFDLIHARLVFAEMPEREQALERLVSALKRGGVLVVEELDWSSLASATDDAAASAVFDKVEASIRDHLVASGVDVELGRRLFSLLRRSGLVDTVARAGTAVYQGGSTGARIRKGHLDQIRGGLQATSTLAADDIDRYEALLDDADFSFIAPLLVTAWGRRAPR